MVILSETVESTLVSVASIVEKLDYYQPIFDYVVGVMNILQIIVPGICVLVWARWFGPHIKFRRFVNSVYTQENLREVLKFYIHTRAQDVDPCEQEEIKENNGKYISCKLISFFIKDAFSKGSSGKFYLVCKFRPTSHTCTDF